MINLETISLTVALLATIVSVLSLLVALSKSRYGKVRLSIKEEDKPNKRAGLILLVGTAKGSAPAAIEYHLPTLRHCWLIATKDGLSTAQQLADIYQGIAFYWGEPSYIVDPDEIGSTYNVVSRILDIEAQKVGLKSVNLIADITGGLKPMAAGITLACVTYQCNMQYMKAPRNEFGDVILGGKPEPIKIDTTFISKAI
jgi:hypothetical protein